MKNLYFTITILLISIVGVSQDFQKLTGSTAVNLNSNLGVNVAIDDNLAVGIANSTSSSSNAPFAFFYKKVNGIWLEEQVISNPGTYDNFGDSYTSGTGSKLALEGNYAFIGSHNYTDGKIFIYEYNGSTWSLFQTIYSTADYFGWTFHVDNNILVVTSRNGIFLYEPVGGVWTLQETISGINVDFATGNKVFVNGTTIAIADQTESSLYPNSGAVYVYDYSGGVLSSPQFINLLTSDSLQRFGRSIAIEEDRMLISFDSIGSVNNKVYLYKKLGSNWQLTDTLEQTSSNKFVNFGQSLAIMGDKYIVGSSSVNSRGKTVVFEKIGGIWTKNDLFPQSAPYYLSNGDYFSRAMSYDDKYLIVGAHFDDDNGANSGAMYIYDFCSTNGPAQSYSICDGDSVLISGVYYQNDTVVNIVIPNAEGCDSITAHTVTILNNTTGIDTQIACDSYVWIDGNTYNINNNTATYVLTNSVGCDSLVTLNLTINNSNSSVDTHTACDSFTWIDNNTYSMSNTTATHTLTNVSGCDSIVTLNLTINNSSSSTDTQVACDNFTWIDGNTYNVSNNSATYTLTTTAGCDSIVTLNLTINYSTSGTDVQTACTSYTWIDGNTYSASNNSATHTLINSVGCDSIVTLDLTINNPNTGVDNQSACGSYTWINGLTYYADNNTATHTLMNASGCDSVVTLNLIVNNVDLGVSTTGQTITASATGGGVSYSWVDCNNGFAPINGQSAQSFTATTSGDYAVIVSQFGCLDTTACVNVTASGLSEALSFESVNVYPNPTTGIFYIDFGILENVSISVLSITGKVINEQKGINMPSCQVEINATPGVYILEIRANNTVNNYKIIKK